MEIFVSSVYDNQSGAYDLPIFTRDEINARRYFASLVLNKETQVGKFPDHFDLHHVGLFDDNSGKLIACEARTIAVGRMVALELKERE